MLFFRLPFPTLHRVAVLKPLSSEDLATSKGHVTGGYSLS